jgi:DNA-binding NtrC family response regulator
MEGKSSINSTIAVAVLDPDDPVTVNSVKDALRDYRCIVIPCSSKAELLAASGQQRIDVAVLKLSKPLEDDLRALAEIQRHAPQTEVIFVAQFDEELVRSWIEVIQRGAYEFLPKPLNREELRYHLLHAAEKNRPVKPRKLRSTASTKGASAGST